MAKTVNNENVGTFLLQLYNDEIPYRIETNHMVGFAISLIKHVEGYSPRVLIDNDNSGFWKKIIAETDENKEKRNNAILPSIDWEARFMEESLIEAVEKLCEYLLYAHPEYDFSKSYNRYKQDLQAIDTQDHLSKDQN